MIVEFIGSTGAGKTTLISAVQRRLAQTAKVSTAYEVVATPLGLNHVTHPTAQNLIQEIAGLPFFIRSLPRYNGFLVFALEMLARRWQVYPLYDQLSDDALSVRWVSTKSSAEAGRTASFWWMRARCFQHIVCLSTPMRLTPPWRSASLPA